MPNDDEPEIKKLKDDFLKILLEDYRYSISAFDSQTVALSGGALGLSLTFIKDIVPFENSTCLGLFFVAQIFFTLLILLAFIGHYRSMNSSLFRIEKALNDDFTATPDKWAKKINLIVVWLLPIAILTLLLYCAINISNSRRFVKEKQHAEQIKND